MLTVLKIVSISLYPTFCTWVFKILALTLASCEAVFFYLAHFCGKFNTTNYMRGFSFHYNYYSFMRNNRLSYNSETCFLIVVYLLSPNSLFFYRQSCSLQDNFSYPFIRSFPQDEMEWISRYLVFMFLFFIIYEQLQYIRLFFTHGNTLDFCPLMRSHIERGG